MLLVIDNYDSFTYNLVQYLGELKADPVVIRNDKTSVVKIKKMRPKFIVISPGPCTPKEAGISREVIREFTGKVPILGVCLGHQCIADVFGGRVIRASRIMHGKTSKIYHSGKNVFAGLPSPFEATRYHSLIVENKSMPNDLLMTAWTKDKEIMGIAHKKHPTWGVQFHPESILTKEGMNLLRAFLRNARKHYTNK